MVKKKKTTKKKKVSKKKDNIAKQILDKFATQVVEEKATYTITENNIVVDKVDSKKKIHYKNKGYSGKEVLWIAPKDCIRIEFEDKEKADRWIAECESAAINLDLDYCVTGHGGTSDYFNIFNIKNIPLGEDNKIAKMLLVDLLMDAQAKDSLDRTNIGWTLSPVIDHPHWKKKYKGVKHEFIRGILPLEQKNEYPNELLKKIKASKKRNKEYKYNITNNNNRWVDDFLLNYCCNNKLPEGSRHLIIEKNLAAYIIHRKDRDDIKKKYYKAQERTHDSMRSWELAIAGGNYTDVGANELAAFIKEHSLDFEIPKTKEDKDVKEEVVSIEDKNIAEDILKNGNPLLYLIDTIQKEHIGDTKLIAIHILSGLSSGFKHRKKTIHLWNVGESGKGKSSAQDSIGKVFSRMDVVTSASAKAKFYKAKAGKLFDGGVMRFDEENVTPERFAIERALTDQTENPPKHESVSDNRTFEEFEIKEINAVWKNSVDVPEDDQLANRYMLLNVDESEEQDMEVFKKQLLEYGTDKFQNKTSKEVIISKIITDKIKEESIKIFIPFVSHIKCNFKFNRRTLPKFLKLLLTTTYCYRFQREKIDDYYISTLGDYDIARILWKLMEKSEETHLTEKDVKILNAMPKKEEDAEEGTISNIAKETKKAYSSVLRSLAVICKKGLGNYKTLDDGTKKKYYWAIFHDFSSFFKKIQKTEYRRETIGKNDYYSYYSNKYKASIINSSNNSKSYSEVLDNIYNSSLLPICDLLNNRLKGGVFNDDKTTI